MANDTLARVHLLTCVGVESEYDHLPHFIAHYTALGILPENFHVIINSSDPDSPNLEHATAVLRQHGIPDPCVWIASYTSDAMWAKRREVQGRVAAPDDWVLSADVDELHEYPESLPAFVRECERRGVNCVQGVMVDRLAPGARLVPVEADRPITQTFPLQADVQCSIGRQSEHHNWYGTVKLMLFRGALFPSRGGHFLEAPERSVRFLFGRQLATFPAIAQPSFRFSVPLKVHHFKWTASMPEALRRRLATPGVSAAGAAYGQRLLDHIERHDGINAADVTFAPEMPDHSRRWRRRVANMKALHYIHLVQGLPRRVARRVLRRDRQ